jgi:uncharacterized coiled-coil protein SlyX
MKMCDRQELLVGYLYDEVDPQEKREFNAHLAVCAECRTELEGLRSTRTHFALWAPPEPDLGFRLIRGAAEPAPALPHRRFAPVFAFAAAAAIVLAVAAAVANVEIRYESDGAMTVRTGWGRPDAVATSVQDVPQALPVTTSAETMDLERRLEALETRLAAQPASTGTVVASRTSDGDILRQVRELINQSESRQRVELAQGLLQIINDVDRRRRADVAMFEQGNYTHQQLTNAELQQTRDIVNQFIRSAAAKQDK